MQLEEKISIDWGIDKNPLMRIEQGKEQVSKKTILTLTFKLEG